MNERQKLLALRRETLQMQIAAQRLRLISAVADLEKPLKGAEMGWRILHFLRGHPVAAAGLGGLGAFLVGKGWRHVPTWPGRALAVWNVARTGWRWWQTLRQTRS
jgi:hypothetical protein